MLIADSACKRLYDAPADYKREPNVSIYYYRDTPFSLAIK